MHKMPKLMAKTEHQLRLHMQNSLYFLQKRIQTESMFLQYVNQKITHLGIRSMFYEVFIVCCWRTNKHLFDGTAIEITHAKFIVLFPTKHIQTESMFLQTEKNLFIYSNFNNKMRGMFLIFCCHYSISMFWPRCFSLSSSPLLGTRTKN